jgi:hypothetical protein
MAPMASSALLPSGPPAWAGTYAVLVTHPGGNVEVEQFCPGTSENHVLRFDVAMNDPFVMGVRERELPARPRDPVDLLSV